MLHRVVILIASLSLLAGFSRTALAKPDPRRDQIEAAQADALAALVDQVRMARLTPEMTVGEFLDRVGGGEQLRQAVSRLSGTATRTMSLPA